LYVPSLIWLRKIPDMVKEDPSAQGNRNEKDAAHKNILCKGNAGKSAQKGG
jgi:hypothetical protein